MPGEAQPARARPTPASRRPAQQRPRATRRGFARRASPVSRATALSIALSTALASALALGGSATALVLGGSGPSASFAVTAATQPAAGEVAGGTGPGAGWFTTTGPTTTIPALGSTMVVPALRLGSSQGGLPVPAPVVVPVTIPPPFVPVGRGIQTTPRPDPCGGYSSPRHISPGVVAGAGSATLSWQADNTPDVQGYRVRAVSQRLVTGRQPDPIIQEVAQPVGCVPVTARVTGLTSGSAYVFWLEEAQRDAATSVVRYVQVGESAPVLIN